MGNTLNNKKANGLALLPFLVFIVVYMGAGLVYQSKGVDMAFYQFPSVTAMFLAVLVAFIMFKGSINEKFDTFAKGAANVDVLTMLIIYILAGAFATVAAEMGGRDATVNLGLSLVPVQFLAAGLFVIAAFMGTATGTSMGTISAITPIAVGVAEKGGLNMMVVLGAVIGGAMFGDNLSMISDTTIAATRSQHCEMRDKFRVNFLTALPAALVTIVVLLIVGRPETVTEIGDLSYSFIKVIPYLLVLILALVGMNVFLVLTIGIFAAGIVGIATGAIATLIPERPYDLERDILDRMSFTQKTGKKHFIIVKAEGVPATFFVMAADNNEEYLPLLERTVQEGHLIALHTCSHDYKSIYKSPDAYWDDLQKLREKLLPYVPADQEIKWLRFPGGSTNTVSHRYGGSDIMKKLKADAESRGFTYVDWNVCAEDSLGGHPSASTIYNNIIREVGDKNTCVVLMHDSATTRTTAEALPDIIRWYADNGYAFLTVAEALPLG